MPRVCNVSRTVVSVVRRRYAHVMTILVTAPTDILAARLAARDRASDSSLSERLRRNDVAGETYSRSIPNEGWSLFPVEPDPVHSGFRSVETGMPPYASQSNRDLLEANRYGAGRGGGASARDRWVRPGLPVALPVQTHGGGMGQCSF